MASAPAPRGRTFWPRRLALATLIALAAVNIWTGGPLLALWLGSRAQGDSSLSMGTVFIVIGTLLIVELALVAALSSLGRRYDTLIDRPPAPRQRATWLRSLRDERTHDARRASELTLLEKMMVASVVLAMMGFETWFFFFAGSSLPRGG